MAERITRAHLDRVAEAINRAAGTPMQPHSGTGYNVGAFFFDNAYEGFSLRQIRCASGSERDILHTGYIPAARAFELAHAFLSGLTFKGD